MGSPDDRPTGTLLVTGAGGLLGREVVAAAERAGLRVVATDLDRLDARQPAAVAAALAEHAPEVVLNCAAYTNVDAAEREVGPAIEANVVAPAVLARATAEAGSILIHLSTDYVFDGRREEPYGEEVNPRPLSVYGWTKLEGEEWVRRLQPRHYVVRSAGLFGGGGRNFVDAVAARLRRGEPLRVVDDQVCSRTYAPDLAAGLVELSGRRVAFGTYHLTNAGAGSWYEFAGTIAAVLGVEVGMTPVSSANWGAAAVRPAYSVLSCAKWAAAGLAPLRDVRRAVAAYLCPRGAGEREGNVDE